MPQWLVIGISGVTCGGKTTLAHNLRDYFKNLRGAPLYSPYNIGEVQLISQDDYFLPVDDLRHKWHEKLNAINFELITSLDMKQMLSDIAWIIKGRYLATADERTNDKTLDYMHDTASVPATTTTPTYMNFEHYALQFQQQYQQLHANANYPNYHHHQQHQQQQHNSMRHQIGTTATSTSNASHIMRVNAQYAAATAVAAVSQLRYKKMINILIIEGFMIFNQKELLALCHLKFHFHLPYEKCYERRRKRTYDPPDVTGYFEMCVWPYYELNFAEYRDCKDITFLNGEICKEKIFKFVLQRIVHYFDQRCDSACPPPQKLIGMLGTVCSGNSSGSLTNSSNSNIATITNGNLTSVFKNMPKVCPMEQQ